MVGVGVLVCAVSAEGGVQSYGKHADLLMSFLNTLLYDLIYSIWYLIFILTKLILVTDLKRRATCVLTYFKSESQNSFLKVIRLEKKWNIFSIFYEEEKIRKEKLIHDPPYRADSTTLTDEVIFLMATSITVKGAKS